MTIVHCHFWIAVCWLTFSFSFACLLAVCSSRNVFITKTFVGFDFFLFFTHSLFLARSLGTVFWDRRRTRKEKKRNGAKSFTREEENDTQE
jgi:uncharacterized membrane protein YbhN (UPF0104 family)